MVFLDYPIYLPYYLKDQVNRFISMSEYPIPTSDRFKSMLEEFLSPQDLEDVRCVEELMKRLIYRKNNMYVMRNYFMDGDPYIFRNEIPYTKILDLLQTETTPNQLTYKDIFEIKTFQLALEDNPNIIVDDMNKYFHYCLLVYVHPGLTNILGPHYSEYENHAFVKNLPQYFFRYIRDHIGEAEAYTSYFNYARLY